MSGKGLPHQAMTTQNGRIRRLLKLSILIASFENFQLAMQSQLIILIAYYSTAE